MKIKDFAREIDPYMLLYSLQNEKSCVSLQKKFLSDLIQKIEDGEEPQCIKNDLEDLLWEITTDYFARGVQYGAQLYVAMMESVEDEE